MCQIMTSAVTQYAATGWKLRFLGIRRANDRDRAKLREALASQVSTLGPSTEDLVQFGYQWARAQ